MTTLFDAVENNDLGAIRKLTRNRRTLEERKNQDAALYKGGTPLFGLSKYGRPQTAELLLKRGANVHARTTDLQQTILHTVARDHRHGAGLVDLLLRWGADVNAADKMGSTPLHFASGRSKPILAKHLIRGGANLDAQDKNGDTPLWSSVYHGDLSTAKVLVDAGADINLKNNDRGETPLYIAAWKARIDFLKLLMRPRADLAATTKNGEGLVAAAIRSNSVDAVKAAELLFERGAPASVRELRLLESVRAGASLREAREKYDKRALKQEADRAQAV
jgi:ankyrin repeat protein